ncbi:MAG: hypothetical protein OEO77_11690 [Acidimicrobiia bacterium]|nr:hypothetical protein [Acidimicrobiia bacterium]
MDSPLAKTIGGFGVAIILWFGIALLSGTWSDVLDGAHPLLGAAGFLVVGGVLGVVITDEGISRVIPGLAAVLLFFTMIPVLFETPDLPIPDLLVDGIDRVAARSATFVVIGVLAAALFRVRGRP